MMGTMQLPKRLKTVLERAQAEYRVDERCWKLIIKHKGLTNQNR